MSNCSNISRSYCLLTLSFVFLTASNILMATTLSGHGLVLEGFFNIFNHIISHVWIMIFPIFNLFSSLIVLSLSRYHTTISIFSCKEAADRVLMSACLLCFLSTEIYNFLQSSMFHYIFGSSNLCSS